MIHQNANWAPIIATIGVFVFGIIFSIIGYFIKVAVMNGMTDMKKELSWLREDFNNLKVEMATDYVKKMEYDKNEKRHENIWESIRQYGERIAKIEMAMHIEKSLSKGD